MSLLNRRGPGLALIVLRSLRQHLLSTCVTVLSTGLACGLVISVFSIQSQAQRAFTGGPIGYDAVLGARGSQLQLVLNTVFHLETSPGNIPWSLYESIRKDPAVQLAIPYAVGDNYYGYRIVGTTNDIFDRFEYQKGRKFEIAPGGRAFNPKLREAVVGSFVAAKTGLHVGSKFNPYHGLAFTKDMKHPEEYVVVGVMKTSNSPSDRVVWIPIEGIYRMKGHVLRGTDTEYTPEAGKEIPDAAKEVSAVMLKFKAPTLAMGLADKINKQGKVATLAYPIGNVMAELFRKIGWMNLVLLMVAYLVIVVAAGSILASIYNTINERRREFAILRALGARKATVFAAIILESGAIAALGAALGVAIYVVILGSARAVLREQTGVVLDVLYPHPALILAPLGMIALGALSGVLPAFKAYATDVATNLTPSS